MHPRLQAPVRNRSVLRIAGNEEDVQVWSADAGGVGHLLAIHAARQPEVRYQEVDLHVGLQHLQARGRVGRLDGLISSSSTTSTVSPASARGSWFRSSTSELSRGFP